MSELTSGPEPLYLYGTPLIGGTFSVGETLTCDATASLWDDRGNGTFTYVYQWQKDGVDIGSATSSAYELVSGDTDGEITCLVTGSNSGGADSTQTVRSQIAGLKPLSFGRVSITGTAKVGETVTVETTYATWDSFGHVNTLSYQWKRGGSNISGATSASYVLQTADEDAAITCVVSATTDNGTDSSQDLTTPAICPVGISYYELVGQNGYDEDDNMTAIWPFTDNAASTAIADSSSNSNDLTLQGGDNTADISDTGNRWNATSLHFDGATDYGDITLGGTTGEFTFSCWVNLDVTSGTQYFMGVQNSTLTGGRYLRNVDWHGRVHRHRNRDRHPHEHRIGKYVDALRRAKERHDSNDRAIQGRGLRWKREHSGRFVPDGTLELPGRRAGRRQLH